MLLPGSKHVDCNAFTSDSFGLSFFPNHPPDAIVVAIALSYMEPRGGSSDVGITSRIRPQREVGIGACS